MKGIVCETGEICKSKKEAREKANAYLRDHPEVNEVSIIYDPRGMKTLRMVTGKAVWFVVRRDKEMME